MTGRSSGEENSYFYLFINLFPVFVSCYPDLDDLRLSIQINCRILGKKIECMVPRQRTWPPRVVGDVYC